MAIITPDSCHGQRECCNIKAIYLLLWILILEESLISHLLSVLTALSFIIEVTSKSLTQHSGPPKPISRGLHRSWNPLANPAVDTKGQLSHYWDGFWKWFILANTWWMWVQAYHYGEKFCTQRGHSIYIKYELYQELYLIHLDFIWSFAFYISLSLFDQTEINTTTMNFSLIY